MTACDPSSGFRAHEDLVGVFQTETQLPENDVPLSPETSHYIEQNMPMPNPGAPPEDEALPSTLNFSVIRVKLLPITKIFPSDPYLKSADKFTVENDSGLRLLVHEGNSIQEHKGNRLSVDLTGKNFTLDDQKITVSDQTILDVIPKDSSSPTWVSLSLDKARLSHAGLLVSNRPSSLSFLGTFQIRPVLNENKLASWALINTVDFESYVRSVVASEVPSSFGAEALKAQAIAARTYALRQMAVVRCVGVIQVQCTPQTWDVDPSTAYQSYLGANVQKPTTSAAVDATKGQFLSSNGQPALTMFHASSGGETISIGEFNCSAGASQSACLKTNSAKYPYLVHAKDPYNGNWKRFGHGVGLPQQSAQGMAVDGKNSLEILQQYYPGTVISGITLLP